MQHHLRVADTQDVVTVNQAVNNTATLPAFAFENLEPAFSSLIAEYPLLNTEETSVQLPLPEALLAAETFVLAVRSTDDSGTPRRYVLHRPYGVDGVLYPDYTGETLYANAVFEIWTDPAETDVVLAAAVTLTLGDYTARGNALACNGSLITLTNTTLVYQEPS